MNQELALWLCSHWTASVDSTARHLRIQLRHSSESLELSQSLLKGCLPGLRDMQTNTALMEEEVIMTISQFESVRAHPRRRPAINDALPALMTESQAGSSKMPLRKGETFNTPTTPSTERDPVLNIRSLPRRTPTSLEAIAASEQHMTSLLERLTLELEDKQADSMSVDENEAGDGLHPDAQKMRTSHSHGSDSGLGSSVGSVADSGFDEEKGEFYEAIDSFGDVSADAWDVVDEDAQLEASAITSSKPSFEPTSSERRQLGLSACKQIERYIILPILKETKLKPFHPLVQSVPRRIVNKKIACLRDLERTLLWLAPVRLVVFNVLLLWP